jgi:hypothetical protein
MQEEVAVLDAEDASTSSEDYVDKSVDTSPESLKVESESEEVEVEQESEAESSPAEVEVLEEKADAPEHEEVQGRIDKLTKNWSESERREAAKDTEIEDLRKQLSEVPEVTEPLKTAADFDFDEAKFNAYQAEEIPKRAREAARDEFSKLQAENSAEVQGEKFADKEKEFAKTVKDYDEKVHDPSLRISAPMAQVIKVQESPELAYYLGSNPDIAKRIASLGPEAAGFEMGKIISSLAVEKAKTAKTVSDAPPPPPKIESGNEGRPRKITDSDVSDAEFDKMRRKQIANR